MIKAILLDFGGVIYKHPKEVIPEVLARIYRVPVDRAIQEYGKHKVKYFTGVMSTNKFIKHLSSVFNSALPIREVKRLWVKYYARLARPDREVLNIINSFRKKGYKTYLYSNTTDMSDKHNSKTGIYDYFDGLFLSYKLGVRKPDLISYQKVLSILKLRPEECVLIDDDQKNLLPAKSLGMKTILFDILFDNPRKLKEKLYELDVKS
jgi:epoxide hydrolase-like predicted phosphatase